ncbi:tripartite tricarboxylate transporter substrate binding protein [Xanthobacteraceae bacterium Astr-EGSB]|uniref:Bug family tripartite tricarboxylate transporter substrate binding protein n=1 Tax=Astrobacterium formosum TaxID=3069710 RepID=UPI0027B4145B|nr:tripartite tricarboxylate transporter substrate binding protein [Xanthobacteraceae bacterium Astr-EGSB]
MFRMKPLVVAAALSTVAAVPFAAAQQFPARDLAGTIQWGAGGGTDVVSRALTPLVEPILGKSIVLTNRPGGTGAIATVYVNSRPADGYNLLYGAENPNLYKVLGLADLDYGNFTAINIMARGVTVIVVKAESPYKSLKGLVDDAKKRPGQVKMATTGTGGLPYMVGSLLKMATKLDVTQVPFDGDGPGITALLGGHVDFFPVAIGAAAEHVKAGRLRPLAVVNAEPVEIMPSAPPITNDYPEFKKYLPWGPFYGVFVKKETPEPVKKTLIEAFKKAGADPRFVTILKNQGNVPMNIAGDEADTFIKRTQSVSAWALQEAGATKESPEKFGIPKP